MKPLFLVTLYLQTRFFSDQKEISMFTTTIIAIIIAIIGCLNWLLVGLFQFNLVAALFGAASIISTIVYVIVGLAGLWLAFYLIWQAIRTESKENGRRSTTTTRETVTKRAKA